MEMVLISVVFILSPSDKVDKPSSLCQAPQGPSLQYSQGKQHQPIPTPLPPPIVTYPPLPPCGVLCLHRPGEKCIKIFQQHRERVLLSFITIAIGPKRDKCLFSISALLELEKCVPCVRDGSYFVLQRRSTARLFSRKGTGVWSFWLPPCVPVVSSAPVSPSPICDDQNTLLTVKCASSSAALSLPLNVTYTPHIRIK